MVKSCVATEIVIIKSKIKTKVRIKNKTNDGERMKKWNQQFSFVFELATSFNYNNLARFVGFRFRVSCARTFALI